MLSEHLLPDEDEQQNSRSIFGQPSNCRQGLRTPDQVSKGVGRPEKMALIPLLAHKQQRRRRGGLVVKDKPKDVVPRDLYDNPGGDQKLDAAWERTNVSVQLNDDRTKLNYDVIT